MKGLVIAGIGTDVGKTVVSAIIVESLKADYWKPIQAGELRITDSHKVQDLITNQDSIIHPEAVKLSEPMSPHAAAKIDGVEVRVKLIDMPKADNTLIIELAGGLLVPLNQSETNLDLIKEWQLPVVLVVNFYLGSINHTLLSIGALKNAGSNLLGLLFCGEVNSESKEVILEISGCKDLGTIPQAKNIDRNFVSTMAEKIIIR